MVPIRSTDVMHLWRRTECRNVGYCKKKALFKTVVIVATVGSSQSEREKVNRGIGEWGHVTSLAYDTSQFGHMTPFRPIRAQYSVTVPQTPGSDRATGRQEVVPLNCFIAQWNNWPLYLCWMLYAYACGTLLGWLPTTHARGVTSARGIVL